MRYMLLLGNYTQWALRNYPLSLLGQCVPNFNTHRGDLGMLILLKYTPSLSRAGVGAGMLHFPQAPTRCCQAADHTEYQRSRSFNTSSDRNIQSLVGWG